MSLIYRLNGRVTLTYKNYEKTTLTHFPFRGLNPMPRMRDNPNKRTRNTPNSDGGKPKEPDRGSQ